jgi:hypothetical protein
MIDRARAELDLVRRGVRADHRGGRLARQPFRSQWSGRLETLTRSFARSHAYLRSSVQPCSHTTAPGVSTDSHDSTHSQQQTPSRSHCPTRLRASGRNTAHRGQWRADFPTSHGACRASRGDPRGDRSTQLASPRDPIEVPASPSREESLAQARCTEPKSLDGPQSMARARAAAVRQVSNPERGGRLAAPLALATGQPTRFFCARY